MLNYAPRQDGPATRRIREQPYMVKQIGVAVPCSLQLWDCARMRPTIPFLVV